MISTDPSQLHSEQLLCGWAVHCNITKHIVFAHFSGKEQCFFSHNSLGFAYLMASLKELV